METDALNDPVQKKLARRISFAALFAFFLTLAIYAWRLYVKKEGTDFDVYHLAARRAAEGNWQGIYSLADAFTPFRYAPLTLLGFYPFSFFSPAAARVLWLIFGQALPTALSFLWLWKISKRIVDDSTALRVTALAYLLTLRLSLSNYLWGQVIGILLLGFVCALSGFLEKKPLRMGLGILFPVLLKVAPGLSLIQAFIRDRKFGARAIGWAVLGGLVLVLAHWIWIGSLSSLVTLVQGWFEMIRMDRAYADPSKYGSQSFLSFFLRLFKAELLPFPLADALGSASSFLFVGWTLWLWWSRKPLDIRGEIHSFGFLVYAFCFSMPQTYSYTHLLLAIPLWGLLLSPLTRKGRIALCVFVPVLSLAGKDIVGSMLFFGLQHLSIPLFAALILYAASLEAYWKHSSARNS